MSPYTSPYGQIELLSLGRIVAKSRLGGEMTRNCLAERVVAPYDTEVAIAARSAGQGALKQFNRNRVETGTMAS